MNLFLGMVGLQYDDCDAHQDTMKHFHGRDEPKEGFRKRNENIREVGKKLIARGVKSNRLRIEF